MTYKILPFSSFARSVGAGASYGRDSAPVLGYRPVGEMTEADAALVREIIHAGPDRDEVDAVREAIRKAGDDPDNPKRLVPFRLSDEARDSYGTRFSVRGWALKRFMENPINLFGHDPALVTGRSARIWRDLTPGNVPALRELKQFVPREMSELADDVFRMVVAGVIRGASVGFQPIDWERDPQLDELDEKEKKRIERMFGGGILFTRTELVESSTVPVPSNPNSLAGRAAELGDLRAWRELVTRHLDGEETVFAPWLECLEGMNATLRSSMEILSTRTVFTPTPAPELPQRHSAPRDPYADCDVGSIPVTSSQSAEVKDILVRAAAIAVTAEEEHRALETAARALVEADDACLARLVAARDLLNTTIARLDVSEERNEPKPPITPTPADPDGRSDATPQMYSYEDIIRALSN